MANVVNPPQRWGISCEKASVDSVWKSLMIPANSFPAPNLHTETLSVYGTSACTDKVISSQSINPFNEGCATNLRVCGEPRGLSFISGMPVSIALHSLRVQIQVFSYLFYAFFKARHISYSKFVQCPAQTGFGATAMHTC